MSSELLLFENVPSWNGNFFEKAGELKRGFRFAIDLDRSDLQWKIVHQFNYQNIITCIFVLQIQNIFIMQGRQDSASKKSNRLQKERSPQPKGSLIQSFKGYLYAFSY